MTKATDRKVTLGDNTFLYDIPHKYSQRNNDIYAEEDGYIWVMNPYYHWLPTNTLWADKKHFLRSFKVEIHITNHMNGAIHYWVEMVPIDWLIQVANAHGKQRTVRKYEKLKRILQEEIDE